MGIQESLNDDVVLWRYMDLSKLLSLLLDRKLTFCRSDKFEDKFEGYPNNYVEHLKSSYMGNAFLGVMGEYKGYYETGLRKNYIKGINYNSFVSCWHINEFESAAMWKLYCTSSDSIAVKTTVGKLKLALGRYDDSLTYGKIHYDFNLKNIKKINHVNLADPLFIKRESFAHEKEFRIVYRDNQKLNTHLDEIKRAFKEFHNQNIENGRYENLTEDLKLLLESGIYLEHTMLKSFYSKCEDKLKKFYENGEILDQSYFENWCISTLDHLEKNQPFVESLEIDPIAFIDELIISPTSTDWFIKILKKMLVELKYNDIAIKKSDLNELN
ncbi:hypothetical protein [Acinetobacter johnsonii]|uniref:hypothetical protein n=1 Tax=Acinetobacter johnsonii TaxID=40214 RepID=UPI00132F8883|nr:hypothetical protein [Acinetobacter johnsonii]